MVEFGATPGISRLRGALTVVMLGILLTVYGVDFLWSDRGSPLEVTTTGTLTDSYPTRPTEKRRGTHYEFQYATPDGRQFTGTFKVTLSGYLDRDGDTVRVIYSPADPADGRLRVTRGGPEFLIVAAGIAVILGGLRVVILEILKRRRRRQAIRFQAGPAAD
jgi:hypothetical protein